MSFFISQIQKIFRYAKLNVSAHVEMMGLIGMGNHPMVGATVAVAISVAQALAK